MGAAMKTPWTLAAILLCVFQSALADQRSILQRERALARQPAELLAPVGPQIPQPPVDGCSQTAYQYTPNPLESLDIDVLQQADATLVVALDLLNVQLDAGDRSVDIELLHKSQILARYLVAICRTGACPGSDDNDERGGNE
jgi:hypothetical protein